MTGPVADAQRTALRVDVTMKGAEFEGKRRVDALLAQTAEVRAAHPRLLVEEVGGPSLGKGVDELRGEDLSRTEVIALPVTPICGSAAVRNGVDGVKSAAWPPPRTR